MRRKLIKQGMGGYTVVLPINWIRKRGLEGGGEVDIDEQRDVLVIAAEGKHVTKSTSLHIEKQTFKFYRSIIGGLYRGGYDEIHVTFTDASILPDLQRAVDLLPGFEILDITSKSCIVRSTARASDLDVHSHFLKMVQSVGTMQTMILECRTDWKSLEGQLFLLRNNILKNRDLIVRTIVQKNAAVDEYLPYYTLVNYVWMMARTLYYLFERVVRADQFQDRIALQKVADYFHKTFLAPHKIDPYLTRSSFDAVFSALSKKIASDSDPLVIGYLISIAMLIEGCNSSLILLHTAVKGNHGNQNGDLTKG